MIGIGIGIPITRGAGAAAYSPAALFAAGEQGYWLDPSDFSTMFQDAAGTQPVTAVGQAVARINDKSGRGNHFIQATAASRPILQQDSSGLFFLLFDGVDDGFNSAANLNPNGANAVQIFGGLRKLSDTNPARIISHGANLTDNGIFVMQGPGAAGQPRFDALSRGTTTAIASYNNAAAAAPVTAVVTGIANISTPAVLLRVNGVQRNNNPASQGTGSYVTHPHFIAGSATGARFNGRIYQLITRFGADLDADQITQAEAFVNARTGAF